MMYFSVILIFLFIFISSAVIFNTLFNKEKAIEKLKYFEDDYEVNKKFENHKENKYSLLKKLSNLLPNAKSEGKKKSKIEIELIAADMPITAEELLIIKIFSSFIGAFLCFVIAKNIILMIAFFILVWNAPKLIITSRKRKRIKEFDDQLGTGIMIISNSLKAGYSFLQAVAAVAEETKDPFSKEFKKLFKEMSLGILEEDALKNLLARINSGDLKLIVNAILIQKDIGGNLSEILDNISQTIRERQKIKDELKTLTAQGKLSGMIVILIPIFLGIVIYVFNKDYILLLFTTKIGLIMVSVSFINQIFGVVMIKKIISIDI